MPHKKKSVSTQKVGKTAKKGESSRATSKIRADPPAVDEEDTTYTPCCSVCNVTEADSGDALAECSECGVAAHAACYTLAAIRPKQAAAADHPPHKTNKKHTKEHSTAIGEQAALSGHKRGRDDIDKGGKCGLCVVGLDACPMCVLCGSNNNRAMTPIYTKAPAKSQWCHVACVIYNPLVKYADGKPGSDILGCADAIQHSASVTCDVCGRIAGAKLKCNHSECGMWMHVTCAKNLGWAVTLSSSKEPLIWCGTHSPESHLTCIPCGECHKDARGTDATLCNSCRCVYHMSCVKAADGDFMCDRCRFTGFTDAPTVIQTLQLKDDDDTGDGKTMAGKKRSATSGAIVAGLAPKLPPNFWTAPIKAVVSLKHKEQVAKMHAMYAKKLPDLLRAVHEGHSLLLYGFGSKRQVLLHLAARCAGAKPLLEVDGLSPGVSAKDIMAAAEQAMHRSVASAPRKRPVVAAKTCSHTIAQLHASSMEPYRVVVAVHSVDTLVRRDAEVLSTLAALARCDSIRLLVSVDSWKFFQCLDDAAKDEGMWLPVHWPSYAPYTIEAAAMEVAGDVTDEHAGAGIHYVLRSLTKAHHQIMAHILALTESAATTVTRSDLFEECRGNMIVSNESTLNMYLTELIDHKIIAETRGRLRLLIPAEQLATALSDTTS